MRWEGDGGREEEGAGALGEKEGKEKIMGAGLQRQGEYVGG